MLTEHGWKAANDNEQTFDAAADSYLRMGGSQRYVAPVVEYFRGRLVATIVSAEVRQMGMECGFRKSPDRISGNLRTQFSVIPGQ